MNAEAPVIDRALTPLERRWLGSSVTVVYQLSINCHIPATVTKVSESQDFFTKQKEVMVYCETSDELQKAGWAPSWVKVGATYQTGYMGRECKPVMTVDRYGPADAV